MARRIKSMKVRGANEIAIYSLDYLKKFCRKYGFGLKFEVAAMIIERARPTAVVLHNCLEIVKRKKKLKTFDFLIKKLKNSSKKIAKHGSRLIDNGDVVLTHCNSSEVIGVLKNAKNEGKDFSVIATITEPLLQGVKTARELARSGIKTTLIVDSAVGYFMRGIDMVMVGTDAMRIVEPKGVINKIGTSLIAIAAKNYNKPFYVIGNTLKIDKREYIVIEERPPEEVHKPIRGVRIRNPAFDLTEWKYVKAVVTEKGVKSVRDILRLKI